MVPGRLHRWAPAVRAVRTVLAHVHVRAHVAIDRDIPGLLISHAYPGLSGECRRYRPFIDVARVVIMIYVYCMHTCTAYLRLSGEYHTDSAYPAIAERGPF